MGGSTSTTQSTNSNQNLGYNPDPAAMKVWQDIGGTSSGLAQYYVNNPPPQATVAGPTGLMQQYWQGAQNPGNVNDLSTQMGNMAQASYGQYVNPWEINLPGQFGPSQLNLPQFGDIPTVSAPTNGPSGLASSYLVNAGQVSGPSVSAQSVSAPGAIAPISGLEQVYAPQLRDFQMGPAERVNAPTLRDFQMEAAAPVTPQGQVSTQSWTAPGTAGQYMDPYTQQVVDVQKDRAIEDWQRATEGQRSQAVAAGAYGGSRQAVEEATGQRDLQTQLGAIQAQGLQQAYQQGAQQFNTEQQLGLQGQQFNVGTGLQAALANQQAEQQRNVQNLSAYLQTQGLSAQTGLQAALANQQAGLTVGQQNLASQLQTQGLGAQVGMQAQLANQQTGLQQALANQQAQEFGAQQQMQASLANQASDLQAKLASAGFNMQGQLANQQTGLQSGLAAQQLGQQGAMFGAQQGMQSSLANQAARMQGLGATYAGGLQGALQTQNLGMQGQQLGLQAATQQQGLRQAQQGLNLQGYGQAANIYNQAGQMGLQGLAAQQQAAAIQQGYQQQVADTSYQNAMNGMMTPFQAMQWLAAIQAQQPLPYTQTQSGTQNTTLRQPPPNFFTQLLGGLMSGAGAYLGAGK
jgi:hypothetical protein